MRNKALAIGFSMFFLITIGLLIAVRMFITGAAGFDDWVMRQVINVAQTYLVPTIEFDDFDFTAPGTVTYNGVRLRAPDGTEIIDAGELVVTLGEFPKKGRPIVIEGITIRDGDLRLIADHEDPDVTFKGLAPFVKKSNFKQQEDLPEEVRLSETLDLRTITLENAGIIFDPADGQPPMRLDDLSMVMNIEPTTDGGAVWHRLDIDIDRGSLFQFVVDGRVDLDALNIALEQLTLRVDVGSESVQALPSALQTILKDHDAEGTLALDLAGDASVKRWREGNLTGTLTVEEFNVGFGEYRLPMESGVIPIKVSKGTALVGPTQIESLDGTLNALLSVDIARQTMPADIEWSVQGLNLRELLRTAAPAGEPPKIAGILSTFGSVTADLTGLPGTVDGRGEMSITEGRLLNMPGVRALNNAVDVITGTSKKEALSDRFNAAFLLDGEGVRVESSRLETQTLLARGTGRITYQAGLDLNLNAGPMEKLQSLLGKVGKVIGEITDQLVTYHVTGTIKEPKVKVKPLGVGL